MAWSRRWTIVEPSKLDNVSRPELTLATLKLAAISGGSAAILAVCDALIAGNLKFTRETWGFAVLIGLAAFFREVRKYLNSGTPE